MVIPNPKSKLGEEIDTLLESFCMYFHLSPLPAINVNRMPKA